MNEVVQLTAINGAFMAVSVYFLRRWLEKVDAKLDHLGEQFINHDKKVAVLEQRFNTLEAQCKLRCHGG